jgi:hypothetical protein
MNTRVWFMQQNEYGHDVDKLMVDNPTIIPRIGEFVDSDGPAGWVTHVQYNYAERITRFDVVINITLKESLS